MPTHCTTCGHKPTGLTGDTALGTATYYLISEKGLVKHQEHICAGCQTFLNVAVHKHITDTKKRMGVRG